MFRHLTFLTALLFAPSVSVAQDPADSARALFVDRMTSLNVPGAQLVVMRGDETVLAVEWGRADSARQRPVTAATLFRVGSISKLFTATAAALLWERGQLDIDGPVDRLVPEFKPGSGRITPRLLAGHLAGVRHYIGRDFAVAPRGWRDVIGPLSLFAADSLQHLPGAKYLYSSFGYNLLGAVIQRAGGKDFRALVADLVTAPMGLRLTHAHRADSGGGAVAAGFGPGSNQTIELASATDLSDRWPSGGYLSTAGELARFGVASVKGPNLSKRVRELLFTPMNIDGLSTGVGFGWRVGKDTHQRVVYHHGGSSVGGRAMVVVWPDAALAVAITTNLTGARFGEAEAIAIGELLLTP